MVGIENLYLKAIKGKNKLLEEENKERNKMAKNQALHLAQQRDANQDGGQ